MIELGRRWTEQEIEYVDKFYESRSVSYIAKKLDRTLYSVKRKAQQLGHNVYACEDLYVRTIAKSFNCDGRVIYRWIDRYGLPYKTVQRGQATCKLISVDNFWKWAESHKELIPWSKYERYSIIPEPSWVENAIKSYLVKNNHKRISEIEKQHVINLRRHGKSFEEIASEMNRTVDSVKHIWRKREGPDIWEE